MYGDPPDWLPHGMVERCNALGQGLVIQTEGGAILAANPAACKILALSWDQMSGVTSMDPRWRAIDGNGNPLPGEKHPVMISLAEKRDVLGFLMGVETGDDVLRWLRVDSTYREVDSKPFIVAVFVDVTDTDVGRAAEGTLQDAFRLVIERSVDVVSRHSPTGEYLYITPSCEQLVGYRPEELVGRSAYELIHPDDVKVIDESHRHQVDRAVQVDQFRMRRKDGSWVLVETVSEPIKDGNGNLVEIQVSTRDISESAGLRRQIRELEELRAELAQREERLRTVLQLLPEALLVVDSHGVVVEANQVADELLGQQAQHSRVADLLPEPVGEETTRMKLGEHWVDARTADVSDSGETILMLVDVTQPVELAESMQSLARLDALTGLLSRAATVGELSRLVEVGEPLGVLFVDLDGFKQINDDGGHDLGDRVLREIACRIQGAVRGDDILARWGGDEFVVIAPGARPDGLPRIAQAIIDAVSEPMPDEVGHGTRLSLSASVGIAHSTTDSPGGDLIAAADEAMYRAKREGKGRYATA